MPHHKSQRDSLGEIRPDGIEHRSLVFQETVDFEDVSVS